VLVVVVVVVVVVDPPGGVAPVQFLIHACKTETSLVVGRGSCVSAAGGISPCRMRMYTRECSGSPGVTNSIGGVVLRVIVVVSFCTLSTKSNGGLPARSPGVRPPWHPPQRVARM
jgi:hypothetical protein